MKLIIALIFAAISASGYGDEINCQGTAIVDNVGRISTAEIKIQVDWEAQRLIYSGPHASIDLPNENLTLNFSNAANGWYLADASFQGHGGELNRFWIRPAADNGLQFIYQGLYGYRITATDTPLQCQ